MNEKELHRRKGSNIKDPHPGFETTGIRANDEGKLAIGLPKAGLWGIAALGVGPEDDYKGTDLIQESVLWIQATDIS